MRYVHIPTKDEVRAARKAAYLDACSVEDQLEALYEAASGRPEKLESVKEKIELIRGRLQK